MNYQNDGGSQNAGPMPGPSSPRIAIIDEACRIPPFRGTAGSGRRLVGLCPLATRRRVPAGVWTRALTRRFVRPTQGGLCRRDQRSTASRSSHAAVSTTCASDKQPRISDDVDAITM